MNYKNIFFYIFLVFFVSCMHNASAMLSENKHILLLNKRLFKACSVGNIEEVALLIEEGAQVNAKSIFEEIDGKDWVPLHVACKYGYIDIVRCLIENGADINAQNQQCLTPLHCAVLNYRRAVVRYLLNVGADHDKQTVLGHTAFAIIEHGRNVDPDLTIAILELFPNQSDEGCK